MAITRRLIKGAPLNAQEHDANIDALENLAFDTLVYKEITDLSQYTPIDDFEIVKSGNNAFFIQKTPSSYSFEGNRLRLYGSSFKSDLGVCITYDNYKAYILDSAPVGYQNNESIGFTYWSVDQNNLVKEYYVPGINQALVSISFNQGPILEVNYNEIYFIHHTYAKLVFAPAPTYQLIYKTFLLKTGKGRYGFTSNLQLTEDDFILIKQSQTEPVPTQEGKDPVPVELLVDDINGAPQDYLNGNLPVDNLNTYVIATGEDYYFKITSNEDIAPRPSKNYRFIGAAGTYGLNGTTTVANDFLLVGDNSSPPQQTFTATDVFIDPITGIISTNVQDALKELSKLVKTFYDQFQFIIGPDNPADATITTDYSITFNEDADVYYFIVRDTVTAKFNGARILINDTGAFQDLGVGQTDVAGIIYYEIYPDPTQFTAFDDGGLYKFDYWFTGSESDDSKTDRGNYTGTSEEIDYKADLALSKTDIFATEFLDVQGSDDARLQAALDKAVLDGKRLVIDPNPIGTDGQWLLDNAILCPSNTNILILTKIKLSDNSRDNWFRSANAGVGLDPNTNRFKNISIIGSFNCLLEGADNPRSTGDSGKTQTLTTTKSFSNSYGTDVGKSGENQKGDWRNIGILLSCVDDVTLRSLKFKNSHAWSISLERCNNVDVEYIDFNCPFTRIIDGTTQYVKNMDGVDIRMAGRNISIKYLTGTCGDDAIAFTILKNSDITPGLANSFEVSGNAYDVAKDGIYNAIVENIYVKTQTSSMRFLNTIGTKIDGVKLKNIYDALVVGEAEYQINAPTVLVGSTNIIYGEAIAEIGDTLNIEMENIYSNLKKCSVEIQGSLLNCNISTATKTSNVNNPTWLETPAIYVHPNSNGAQNTTLANIKDRGNYIANGYLDSFKSYTFEGKIKGLLHDFKLAIPHKIKGGTLNGLKSIDPDTNMIDPNREVKQFVITEDGTEISVDDNAGAATFSTSEFIDVESFRKYFFTGLLKTPRVLFYDKDKLFISGIRFSTTTETSVNFTTPINTAFVRLSSDVAEGRSYASWKLSPEKQYTVWEPIKNQQQDTNWVEVSTTTDGVVLEMKYKRKGNRSIIKGIINTKDNSVSDDGSLITPVVMPEFIRPDDQRYSFMFSTFPDASIIKANELIVRLDGKLLFFYEKGNIYRFDYEFTQSIND